MKDKCSSDEDERSSNVWGPGREEDELLGFSTEAYYRQEVFKNFSNGHSVKNFKSTKLIKIAQKTTRLLTDKFISKIFTVMLTIDISL